MEFSIAPLWNHRKMRPVKNLFQVTQFQQLQTRFAQITVHIVTKDPPSKPITYGWVAVSYRSPCCPLVALLLAKMLPRCHPLAFSCILFCRKWTALPQCCPLAALKRVVDIMEYHSSDIWILWNDVNEKGVACDCPSERKKSSEYSIMSVDRTLPKYILKDKLWLFLGI